MASAMACMVLSTGFVMTSCSDDDDEFGTNQYIGGVTLNVFGPSPVARGGELRFLGSGMDQIQSVTIPGCGDITDITRVSSDEIRVTVPQTAEPGYVVLHYASGEIKTKTLLTFTEPIVLESISPLAVKAGDEITLKGDYLNLIHEVIFTDEAIVPEEDFTSHSRYEIKLRVPAEAQSGKVIISDAAEIPNWIYSEEEITVALPTVDKVLDLTGAKPGQTVEIKGNNLDLVTKVTMPNEDEVEFTVKGNVLTFILPANVTDGTVCIIPASGVKVAAATIGVAIPEEVVAEPATDLWEGDAIKFKGVNMELVNTIMFPGAKEAVEPASKSATELAVTIPAGLVSGDVVLTTGSGAEVKVAVSTIKPTGIAYDPAPAALAGPLTVKGVNLDHVKAIRFAGDTDVDVENPTATEFSVTVPATLQAGSNEVAFVLTNGEVVEAPAIELTAPECAYATALPGEDVEIRAGETFVLTIANEDKLIAVKVNDQNVQYILNGTQLIVQVPGSCGKSAKVTLVSSNGEISYDIAVIPATHVGITAWEGMWKNNGWEGNQDLAWGGFDWSTVPAGATLTLYMTPTVAEGEWWCVSLRHADGWGNLPDPIPGQYDTPENGIVSVELTAGVLADLVASNGLVITGSEFVLNKVMIEWENSLETVIWTGPWTNNGWEGNQDLAWGGFDWSTVKPGTTVRFYTTSTVAEGEWWCISLRHADGWGNLPEPIPGQYDTPASPLEVVFTADVLNDIINSNGLVVTGSNFQLDKITIE